MPRRPLVLALLAALATAAPAAAAPPATVLSVPSPFAGCSVVDTDPTTPPRRDLELEPAIAADPRDGDRLVAAWIADENLGVLSARSGDGGRTWSAPVVVPGITTCSGGDRDLAFNPSLAIGPDGTVYLAATSQGGGFPTDPRFVAAGVAVATSRDAGRTWATTTVPVEGAIDYPTIAVDPSRPGEAVVAVSRRAVAVDAVVAARTTDGGRTFDLPGVVRVVEPGRAGFARVLALGDRRYATVTTEFLLPVVFGAAAQEGDPLGGPASVRVLASADGGRSWTEASTLATRTTVPGLGGAVVAGGRLVLSALATEPGGTTALTVRTFDEALRPGAAQPVVRGLAGEPQDPVVAADDRGRLALAAALPEGDGLQRVVLWREAEGAAPWPALELLGAARPPGIAFYGRPAITGTRNGVGVVSIAGAPLATDGTSDVVFQRVG